MLHAQALVYSDDPSALGKRIVRGLAGPFAPMVGRGRIGCRR